MTRRQQSFNQKTRARELPLATGRLRVRRNGRLATPTMRLRAMAWRWHCRRWRPKPRSDSKRLRRLMLTRCERCTKRTLSCNSSCWRRVPQIVTRWHRRRLHQHAKCLSTCVLCTAARHCPTHHWLHCEVVPLRRPCRLCLKATHWVRTRRHAKRRTSILRKHTAMAWPTWLLAWVRMNVTLPS